MAKLFDLPSGYVGTIGDNEIEIVSTMRDPPKIRLAVRADLVESNLGCVSFNTIRADGSGTQDEYGYVMGRLTADRQGGALYLGVKPSGGESVREVLYIDNHQAIFRVPIVAPNLGPSTGRVTRFYTDHGEFCVNWQDDGTGLPRGIVYDTHGSANESTWTAVGQIPLSPL